MIPLASNSAYLFPEVEFERRAFWYPPVRQTSFLQRTAVSSVDLNLRGCPRVIAALSTGISTKSFGVANKPRSAELEEAGRMISEVVLRLVPTLERA